MLSRNSLTRGDAYISNLVMIDSDKDLSPVAPFTNMV